MCINTQIQRLLDEKATLDAKITKLEKLAASTTPVKDLLSDLLKNYSEEAPEDLPAVWQEVLAIGAPYNFSVQPLSADELRQWESANTENEKLKAELEELKRKLENSPESRPAKYPEPELYNPQNSSLTTVQAGEQNQETQAETIPALTLCQPWATLLQHEIKRVETRSWATSYRGPIAIHAAKRSVDISDDVFKLLPDDCEFPLGAVVAIANLIDCVEMTPEFIAQQLPIELQCGDWQPGRFAWILEIIRPVVPPILATGGQKLWNWSGTSIKAELEYLNEYDECFEEECKQQETPIENDPATEPTIAEEVKAMFDHAYETFGVTPKSEQKTETWDKESIAPVLEELHQEVVAETESQSVPAETTTQTNIQFQLGDQVNTQYGDGIVDKIFPERDELYVKRDTGGFTCYRLSKAFEDIKLVEADSEILTDAEPEPTTLPLEILESQQEKTDTNLDFEALGFNVKVYPQHSGDNLVGTTFRFLSLTETNARGDEGKMIFSKSLLKTEIGDRPYKTIAWDLIQDWRDKESARLEQIANPHAKEEDKFVELVKLSNSVGYLKRRDNGELLAGYAAFSNKDESGVQTPTKAKSRAQKWTDFLRANYKASEVGENLDLETINSKISEPRKSKRLISDNPKLEFVYEIKFTGVPLDYLERVAQQDLSLLPGQVAKTPVVTPVAESKSPIFRVKVNSFEIASGTEQEMQSRFEEELKTFGSEGRFAISLTCNGENVEAYYSDDFAFMRAQDFDEENPEYFTVYKPTKTNFRVYRSLASGSDWINSIYPYRPNLFGTKEAAAVDAARRLRKAQSAG